MMSALRQTVRPATSRLVQGRVSAPAASMQARCFAKPSNDLGPDKTHLHDKHPDDHKANIQSSASKSAHEDRASPSGASQATSRRDERNNNKRAEEDHPEAPRPVIGMNEERGTKGH